VRVRQSLIDQVLAAPVPAGAPRETLPPSPSAPASQPRVALKRYHNE
jgi:hypothetical protein